MKKPLVSVIVPTCNNAHYIEKCIQSIINQSFNNFELIIVDDCSKDDTLGILKKIKDKNLNVLKTDKNSGPAVARNIGVKNSRGEYIFFIDGDCIASKNWIKEGLKGFKEKGCLGVEGKIYYVSKNYRPTAIDDIGQNLIGGQYMTGNIAYKKEILVKIGGFDPKLKRMEDRDLGLMILRKGNIIFNPKMIVFHQKFPLKFKKKINLFGEVAKAKVHLFKKYNDTSEIFFRVYRPLNLISLFFPPAILGALLTHKYQSLSDFKTLLYIYPAIFYERLSLWKEDLKEGVFLI